MNLTFSVSVGPWFLVPQNERTELKASQVLLFVSHVSVDFSKVPGHMLSAQPGGHCRAFLLSLPESCPGCGCYEQKCCEHSCVVWWA